jgi:hypothetical protein
MILDHRFEFLSDKRYRPMHAIISVILFYAQIEVL